MKLILSLAIRNALRNQRRSLLTALTVLLGTALLTIGLSWISGVFSSMITSATQSIGMVRVASKDYIDKEQLAPLYHNLPRTGPLITAIEAVPGVRAAWPRIQMGVAASKGGQELGETFGLMVGAPVGYFDREMGLRARVAEGRFFSDDPELAKDEALVGAALARQMEIRAGDKAIFVGQTQDGSMAPVEVTVAGVVDTGVGSFDKQIYLPLEKARWMADIPDGAIEVLVFGGTPAEAGALSAAVTSAVAPLADDVGVGVLVVQPWSARDPWASMLVTARFVLGIVGGIIVFVSALGVLNTMLMSVMERTAEIGVLRALGLSGPGTVVMFVVEAMAIAAVGGLIGVVLGSAGGLWLETVGVDLGARVAANMPPTLPANRVLRADWTPTLALAALLLGQLMALLGAAIPALRATAIQPVAAMRARR